MVEERDFLEFAADVFGVAPTGVSFETTLCSMPEWDSMAHLRLVMAVQSKYGVEIPFAEVTNVTSLWEFYRRINGLSPKKVVAVDLDGTLWDGVAGEDGPDAVRPNAALQAKLKELNRRGVLLVALSKKNLVDVAAELNLGVDSFVFVDDNPAERIEMKARLPNVAVAGFPPNLDAYFPDGTVTEEDRHKTEEYRAEAKRREWAESVRDIGGLDMWKELGAWADVHDMLADEAPRVAQLSQKANQFNVCTNRYTEDVVRRLAAEGLVVTVRAADRHVSIDNDDHPVGAGAGYRAAEAASQGIQVCADKLAVQVFDNDKGVPRSVHFQIVHVTVLFEKCHCTFRSSGRFAYG